MNETNMKHGYSLIFCDASLARGTIWNPGAQISKAGAEFMSPGPQGRNTGPECSTWHKFSNPGGAISTKKCPISNTGGTILTKNVLFTTQGQGAEF